MSEHREGCCCLRAAARGDGREHECVCGCIALGFLRRFNASLVDPIDAGFLDRAHAMPLELRSEVEDDPPPSEAAP